MVNKNTPIKSLSEPPEIQSPTLGQNAKKLFKNLDNHKDTDSADSTQSQLSKNFVLPLINKSQLPSILADSYRENLAFYTPRARRARIEDEERRSADSNCLTYNIMKKNKIIFLAPSGSSRRKQNLFALKSAETGDVAVSN